MLLASGSQFCLYHRVEKDDSSEAFGKHIIVAAAILSGTEPLCVSAVDVSDCRTLLLWASDNSRSDGLVSWSDPQDCNLAGFAGRVAHLAEDEAAACAT